MSQSKKILLLVPPFYRLYDSAYPSKFYPHALGYLGATVHKETDWEVMTYNPNFCPVGKAGKAMNYELFATEGFNKYLHNLNDFSYTVWKEVERTILEFAPSVVGISVNATTSGSAAGVAKLAKSINPAITVVVGGPHPSLVGAQVFSCKEIDICVKGEGERTIVELLNALEKGRALETIPGLVLRKGDKIIETAPRELITDLDSLCFPHESAPRILKDYERYPFSALSGIFTGRGCPFDCFFCGSSYLWGHQVRSRSVDNVLRQMQSLRREGASWVHFEDDTFGADRDFITDLCRAMIADGDNIRWGCQSHVRLIDAEILKLMKRAGCELIFLGVESGNNNILKAQGKQVTIEESFAACRLIRKTGMAVATFFMIGFPQETESTLADTVRAIRKIKSDHIVFSVFTPYPGTAAFALCVSLGLIVDNYDPSLYNHQSPLNYFCPQIPKPEFHAQVLKIARIVDSKNACAAIRWKILHPFLSSILYTDSI